MPDASNKLYRTTVIVWFAMLVSIGLYYLLPSMILPEQADPNSPLIMPLLGAAVLSVIMGLVLRPRFKGRPQRVQAGYILAYALNEAAAVFGLVIHFISAWPKTWIFFAIAAAGFTLSFPQRADFGESAGQQR